MKIWASLIVSEGSRVVVSKNLNVKGHGLIHILKLRSIIRTRNFTQRLSTGGGSRATISTQQSTVGVQQRESQIFYGTINISCY